MKKTLILLAAVMLTSSVVGCGCCRRLRDRLNRGAYCGPAAATPAFIAPQPVVTPPVVAPQVIAPQVMAPQPVCIPCQPACVPCQPECVCDPCCETYGYGGVEGIAYPVEGHAFGGGWAPAGCDSCSGGAGVGDAMGISPTPMGNDPGPIPPGP